MKKLLIATTALVATAGVAAAEVAVSGNGRMGVVYNGTDLNFSSRIRVVFTASGETDGGLSFGGTFRADNAGGAANGSAGEIFISGAFGKIAMGDVVGAAESVIGNLPEIGFQDLDSNLTLANNPDLEIGENDITFITGDSAATDASNPVLLYTYTAGDLTFALSFSDGVNTARAATATVTGIAADTQEYALGVKYALGDYSIALGYEVTDPAGPGNKVDHVILAADAKFGNTAVKGFYGKADVVGPIDFTQFGVGVTHTMDALTIKGYAKNQEFAIGNAKADVTSFGIGAEYSLGGGATIAGGIADNDVAGSDPVADLGIKFTF